MATTADTVGADQDRETQLERDPSQQTVDGGSDVGGGAIGASHGSPRADDASRLLRSPALASSANSSVRTMTLTRTQQTFGNRFAQRAVEGKADSTKRGGGGVQDVEPPTSAPSTDRRHAEPEVGGRETYFAAGRYSADAAKRPVSKEAQAKQKKKSDDQRSGAVQHEAPETKPAPVKPVARKSARREARSAREPFIPPAVEATQYPAIEPPIDLTEPKSTTADEVGRHGAQPYNPEIAALEVDNILGQLQSTADLRKLRVAEHGQHAKDAIGESGALQIAEIRSQIADSRASVRKKVGAVRSEVDADAKKVKATVPVVTKAGYGLVMTKTATAIATLESSALAKKKKASDAVIDEREAVRKFGRDEGKRGREAMAKQGEDALNKGKAKAAGYPDDGRGRVQAEAVMKIASEVAAKLPEPGPALEKDLVDGGKELADGIADADKQFALEVDKQTPALAADLLKQGASLEPQFETIRTGVTRGIDDFVGETNGKLDDVAASAESELRALEIFVVSQIETTVRHIQAMIDGETAAQLSSIDTQVGSIQKAVRHIPRPHVAGVRSAVGKAAVTLDRMVGSFDDALADFTSTAEHEFDDAGSKLIVGIDSLAANVRAGVASVRAPVRTGLDTLGKKAKEGSDKVVEEWGKVLDDTQKSVDRKYDEAIEKMVAEIRKNLQQGKSAMTSKVDEAIAKNRKPLDELEGKMEEAAKEARDKYDAPWYKKLGRWLLHALTSFLKALGMFLLLIVAFVAAIVLLIVGIVLDIVVLIVIAIIAIVALVIYVVYNIVKGIIARVRSANTWYGAIWGVVVGIADIVGIPGLIEGIIHRDIVNGRELSEEEAGDRFGSGLFAALAAIIPAKLKGAGVPLEGPSVPVEVPIAEPMPVVPLPEPTPVVPVPEPRPTVPLPEPRPPVPTPEPNIPEPPKPAPVPEPPKPAPAPEPPKPAPAPEPPKPAPAPEPPKPAPAPEPPKPASAPEPPKPAPAPEPPKPAPAPEPPKPAPAPEPPKPAPAPEPPKPAPAPEPPKPAPTPEPPKPAPTPEPPKPAPAPEPPKPAPTPEPPKPAPAPEPPKPAPAPEPPKPTPDQPSVDKQTKPGEEPSKAGEEPSTGEPAPKPKEISPQELRDARLEETRLENAKENANNLHKQAVAGLEKAEAELAQSKALRDGNAAKSPRTSALDRNLAQQEAKIAEIEKRIENLEKLEEAQRTKIDGIDKRLAELDQIKQQYKGAKPWRDIPLDDPNHSKVGLVGELEMTTGMESAGYEAAGKTVRPSDIVLPEDFQKAFEETRGTHGPDGLYKKTGPTGEPEFAVGEAKTTGAAEPKAPTGKGALEDTQAGTQLSDSWIMKNLDKSGLTAAERAKFEADLAAGKVKKYYVQHDSTGTHYYEVTDVSATEVKIGKEVKPGQ